MTTTNLGKVAITPRGVYNPATAYTALDLITYGGSSYLVLQPVTGVTPTNDGVNYQYSGQAGTPGANGTPGAQQLNGINNQTASYTAVLSDMGTDVRFNSATAVTYTIPPHASVAFPIGALLPFSQEGAGAVTATAGAGVTIVGANGLATTAPHDFRVLEQTAIDNWRVL